MASKPDKLIPADWQLSDIAELTQKTHSANWSDMGCYKTSTALWMMDYVLRTVDGIENPAVLVVTNKSGKGAFYRDVPKTIDGWTILNYDMKNVSVVVGDKWFKAGKTLAEREKLNYPHIVATHWQVFQKCNLGKKEICPDCGGIGAKDFRDIPAADGSGKMHNVGLPCEKCKSTGQIDVMPLTKGDLLLMRDWDLVIIDEAHRIKNRDTKWTANIKRLRAPRKHIMTGTGIINRPDELWSLLNFLDPQEFKHYGPFRDYYCEVDSWTGWDVVKGILPHRRKELRKIVHGLGPRREKLEVFKNLSEPIYEDIDVDLSPTQLRMYNDIKRELATLDQRGYEINSPNVLSMLNRLRQITVATPEVVSESYDEETQKRKLEIRLVEPSSKLDALMDVIEGIRWDDEDKQQIVVFSGFNDPLDLLEVRLTKKHIPFIRLHSKDNDQTRYNKWRFDFPKKEHQVFLSTMQLGGESIDLTSAEYVAFLDLSWSPKDNNQARDRVWRPGQTKTPVVFKFFGRETVDYYVLNRNIEKQGWFAQIFGKDDNNV